MCGGGCPDFGAEVGDIITLKKGQGYPTVKFDRPVIILVVAGRSALTTDGIQLNCNDWFEKTGQKVDPKSLPAMTTEKAKKRLTAVGYDVAEVFSQLSGSDVVEDTDEPERPVQEEESVLEVAEDVAVNGEDISVPEEGFVSPQE